MLSADLYGPSRGRTRYAVTGEVGLSESIQAFTQVLRIPAPDSGWRGHLSGRLNPLRQAFAEYRAATEGTDGLYAQVISEAPRLAHEVHGLVAEHGALDKAMAILARQAADTDADAETLRRGALDVLGGLSRHRQHVADVVYTAYAVDIGGE
jgi:hypothetical protein